MTGGEDDEFAFVCPECAESLSVNDSMKAVLIEKGCVVCGTTVTDEAFSPSAPPNSG